MKLNTTVDIPYLELLACHIRANGVHLYDGFPTFFTTAHSDADIALVTKAFKDAVHAMKRDGFFNFTGTEIHKAIADRPAKSTEKVGIPVKAVPLQARLTPPVANARLGRDAVGNPAWFVENPDKPGQYVQLGDSL